jgi:hypothetical protein
MHLTHHLIDPGICQPAYTPPYSRFSGERVIVRDCCQRVCASYFFSDINLRELERDVTWGLDTSYFGAMLTRCHIMCFCRVYQQVLPRTMFPWRQPPFTSH